MEIHSFSSYFSSGHSFKFRIEPREMIDKPLKGLITAWLLVIGISTYFIASYETTAGIVDSPPLHLPDPLKSKIGKNKNLLIMGLHPKCPCSLSSIRQLEKLLTQSNHDPKSCVFIFFKPKNEEDLWVQGNLSRMAQRLKVQNIIDEGGDLLELLGIRTSGHTLIYSNSGRLKYSGGLTPSRGHEGTNSFSRAALDALRNETQTQVEGLVFGCSIK